MTTDDHPRIRSRRTLIGLVATVAVLLPALAAAPAGATGPRWPGETLKLKQTNRAVGGKVTSFVASGANPDYNDKVTLEVFAKDRRVDPTCAASYIGEQNTNATEVHEKWVVMLLPEGTAPNTFRLPFKIQFKRSGPMLLCAYSKSVLFPTADDGTLAAAHLRVNVHKKRHPKRGH
jgi:hypothetical protein